MQQIKELYQAEMDKQERIEAEIERNVEFDGKVIEEIKKRSENKVPATTVKLLERFYKVERENKIKQLREELLKSQRICTKLDSIREEFTK